MQKMQKEIKKRKEEMTREEIEELIDAKLTAERYVYFNGQSHETDLHKIVREQGFDKKDINELRWQINKLEEKLYQMGGEWWQLKLKKN